MSGRRWLPEWQRADIVAAVVAARAAGARWKDLEERYGMSAKQLRRYLAEHRPPGAGSRGCAEQPLPPARDDAGASRDVSRETMSQKISGMSHRGGCAGERAA